MRWRVRDRAHRTSQPAAAWTCRRSRILDQGRERLALETPDLRVAWLKENTAKGTDPWESGWERGQAQKKWVPQGFGTDPRDSGTDPQDTGSGSSSKLCKQIDKIMQCIQPMARANISEQRNANFMKLVCKICSNRILWWCHACNITNYHNMYATLLLYMGARGLELPWEWFNRPIHPVNSSLVTSPLQDFISQSGDEAK